MREYFERVFRQLLDNLSPNIAKRLPSHPLSSQSMCIRSQQLIVIHLSCHNGQLVSRLFADIDCCAGQ